jgi:hypothetical protein
LRAAYESVDALAGDAEFLRLPSVQLGHLRAWAAELAVKRLIDTGKWGFDYEWQPYKNETGHWLRLRLANSLMSVHQLGDPSKTPRKADYRSNGFLNNQGVLFPEFIEEQRPGGLPHLVLTHGYQELAFACVALPRVVGRGYYARSGNLLKGIHLVDPGVPAAEGVGLEPEVELARRRPKS